MCGICGFWYFDPAHLGDEAMLHSMTAQLVHRGPDDAGCYLSGSLGLGFRRLSILDLQGSQQPMPSEDERRWLVCNGEIYNYLSLRAALSARHQFRTRGDVEPILHLYEDYGSRCVDHLRGMFAFALWDGIQQQLMLSVDRFGKKPLYYALDSEKIVFGSELKAVLRCPGISRDLDYEALDQYLACGYIAAPRSIYASVRKLPPGYRLMVSRDGVQLEPYWIPTFAEPDQFDRRLPAELAAELRHLLTEAVRLRMASDVPVGAFLSGGVDSSAVVALMTEVSGKPVKTYSIGFDQPAYDERPYAQAAASFLGCEHQVDVLRPDALDLLPRLVHHFDEPFADSSMIPTYLVSRLASQQVKVVLSGDGGDEVFAGYHQHLYAYRQQFLELIIPLPLHRSAAHLSRFAPRRIRPYLVAVDQPPTRWLTNGFFSLEQRGRLYASDFTSIFASSRPSNTRLDPLSQLQQRDLADYLPGDILVKVDRASMLASLEVRSPLLDQAVFEFMARVPPRLRVTPRGGKALLKRALRGVLPPSVYLRKKQGFSIPQSEWLRGALTPMLRDLLLHSCFPGLLDQAYVARLIDQHRTGQADHKDRLWALLCLELWGRERA